jgi:phosphate transport system permease protein
MQKAMEAVREIVPLKLRLTPRPRWPDALVRLFVASCGGFVLITTLVMIGFLARTGLQGMSEVGVWPLLTGLRWKPEADEFGGLPLILGTFVSAVGAALLGATPAVLAAVWLTEFSPKSIQTLTCSLHAWRATAGRKEPV